MGVEMTKGFRAKNVHRAGGRSKSTKRGWPAKVRGARSSGGTSLVGMIDGREGSRGMPSPGTMGRGLDAVRSARIISRPESPSRSDPNHPAVSGSPVILRSGRA